VRESISITQMVCSIATFSPISIQMELMVLSDLRTFPGIKRVEHDKARTLPGAGYSIQ